MYLNELNEILNKAFEKLGYKEKVSFSFSDKKELCDYQCNDIFKIAKLYKKNPIEIGESIEKEILSLENFKDYFNSINFVKPGFLNVKLSDKFINKYLKLFNEDITLSIDKEKALKVVLDYGGPNVAKPLHVGHMRTAIVGESIKRIFKFFGNSTISDVHLGDFGLQIGQVIYKILEDNKSIDEIDIKYLDEVYPKMSAICKEDESIKEKCAEITLKLQEGFSDYRSIWKKICEVSISDIKNIYNYLNVSFDYFYGESDAYNYIKDTTKVLSPIIEDSKGAKVIFVNEENDKKELPPLLYQKSDGGYLYASTDLATIYQRKKDFNPDKIIYITDVRQSLHFEQFFRASDKGGLYAKENLEHLVYGTVNGEDGKPYKTRSGDTPKLADLFKSAKEIFVSKREENKTLSEDDLDIIVNSILKFADFQNSREKDYIFDLNKFSEVSGKTGPYILYTYLRFNKILNNNHYDNNLSDNIYNEVDFKLRLKLLEVGEALNNAYIERKPNYIAEYLYSLCSDANIFYQNNNISDETDSLKKNDYLYTLNLTNKIIKQLLELLIIDIPSKM